MEDPARVSYGLGLALPFAREIQLHAQLLDSSDEFARRGASDAAGCELTCKPSRSILDRRADVIRGFWATQSMQSEHDGAKKCRAKSGAFMDAHADSHAGCVVAHPMGNRGKRSVIRRPRIRLEHDQKADALWVSAEELRRFGVGSLHLLRR